MRDAEEETALAFKMHTQPEAEHRPALGTEHCKCWICRKEAADGSGFCVHFVGKVGGNGEF